MVAVLDPRFKTEWIIRDGTVSNQLSEIHKLLVEAAECSNVESKDTVTEDRSAAKKARIFSSYESNSSVVDTAKGEME